MKKWTAVLAALFISTVFCSLAPAQESPQFPDLPPSVVGPQLIAWSYLQRPQPTQQAAPASERTAQSQPEHLQPEPDRFTLGFVGMIVNDQGRYVLQSSTGTALEIDDQMQARLFEGKQVRIRGNLDATGNLLRATSIELP